MIVSWWSYSTPLWYAQLIEGRRPDIFIVDDRTRLDQNLGDLTTVIDGNLGKRPVYVIRIDQNEMALLQSRYNLTPLASPRAGNVLPGDATRLVGPAGSHLVTDRVARLSYFFPAHNEEANLRGLVEEALETLPALAETFEIIIVNDGSRDATGTIADELAAAHPDVVRAVHHPTNLGYGAALLSGFRAARYELVAFTDGDRQFRVADLGRLIERLAEADAPDIVVGYRIKRADPLIRTVYARLYRFANRIWFGLKVRDVDCACKLFRREALAGHRGRVRRGVLLGRAADQAPGRRADGSPRSACRTTRGRPAHRPARSRA